MELKEKIEKDLFDQIPIKKLDPNPTVAWTQGFRQGFRRGYNLACEEAAKAFREM